MRIVYKSAEPRPGMETAYMLACKHRSGYGWLVLRTPWWQPRRKRRRWNSLLRAIDRFHRAGQDVVLDLGATAPQV